jgi:hypothetical protein
MDVRVRPAFIDPCIPNDRGYAKLAGLPASRLPASIVSHASLNNDGQLCPSYSLHSAKGRTDGHYYRDPETGLPHLNEHGVTEPEAEWVLAHPAEDEACSGGSRQALGHTQAGRYLRVIYVPDEEGDGVFVVTA